MEARKASALCPAQGLLRHRDSNRTGVGMGVTCSYTTEGRLRPAQCSSVAEGTRKRPGKSILGVLGLTGSFQSLHGPSFDTFQTAAGITVAKREATRDSLSATSIVRRDLLNQLSHTAWLLPCLRPGALRHSTWLCGIHITNPGSPQIGMCLCVTVVPLLQPGFTKSVFSPCPTFLSALRIGVEHTCNPV